MTPTTPSDQREIVLLCDAHENAYRLESGFRPCTTFKSYLIKYDSAVYLRPQYETQKYLHNMAVGDPRAPRIPEVVDYFVVDNRMAYLVTEFIDATTPAGNAPEKVADALRWLHNVPAPPGVVLGSVGGGPARHRLFGDYQAPLLFSSKKALENYMNKVRPWYCTFRNQPAAANRSSYRLSAGFRPKGSCAKYISAMTKSSSPSPTWRRRAFPSTRAERCACSLSGKSHCCQNPSLDIART